MTKSSKEPLRAYITGTTETSGKGKLTLIVETTHKNHPKYLEILEHIKEKLEKGPLDKSGGNRAEAAVLPNLVARNICRHLAKRCCAQARTSCQKRGLCRNP